MSLSLLQRVQARLNSNQDNHTEDTEKNRGVQEQEDVDSESDIDDDITLDQCISVVEKKSKDPNSSFTRIVNLERTTKNSTLKEVVSLRIEKQKNCNLEPVQFERNRPSSPTINTNPKQIFDSIATTTSTEQSSYREEPPPYPRLDGAAGTRKRKTTKLTDNEKQKREEERLTKKRQQEEEKMTKRKKREEEKLERELAKEKLKAEKTAATMNKRSERREESMCKIVAIVDPSLVEGLNGASILKELQDIGVRYELKSLPISSCIGWLKENADYSVDGKTVAKKVTYEEESHILHKMTANELAYRVDNELNGENEDSLSQLVTDMKKSFKNKKLTILLTGMNAYHRSHKTNQNRQFRAQALGYDEHSGKKKRKKKNEVVPVLTRDQIEGMLVQVQTLHDHVFFRKCEDTTKIGQFVTSFTRSIAEAPFKKESNSSLQFCSIGSFDKASIKVLDDGAGILSLWNQQLQQFYGVRHETSVAITQHFPTPRALSEAYDKESPTTGPFLLQDIEVRRGVGVLQTNRRVGPELSKRVYKLMTSINGEDPFAK